MAKKPATSREGRHYRNKNVDDPVARYAKEAIEKSGFSASDLADKLHLSKSAVSQWQKGNSHPRLENLIPLSLQTGVSLGRLSAIGAELVGKKPPHSGEIEGRFALLPVPLQKMVLEALDFAEKSARDTRFASAKKRSSDDDTSYPNRREKNFGSEVD